MTNKQNKSIQRRFKIGDRVAERPKTHSTFAIRKEAFESTRKFRTQRYGTVMDIFHMRAKDKRVMRYLLIKWDHLQSPSKHSQCRICHLEDFPQIMNQTCIAID
jgi:hypothetical protein